MSEEIVEDFSKYAEIVFARFGNRVPHWFTVNEPHEFCSLYSIEAKNPPGYFTAITIPRAEQQYFCGHHVLLSHGTLTAPFPPNPIPLFSSRDIVGWTRAKSRP